MAALHISGIRIAHVPSPPRAVRVNRPESVEGPISWGPVHDVGGRSVRVGRGESGVGYRLRKEQREWLVCAGAGGRSGVQIGSARLEDHALALAAMWEQAVLAGRIDMS